VADTAIVNEGGAPVFHAPGEEAPVEPGAYPMARQSLALFIEKAIGG
jgi:hypothetical protein